MKLHSHETFRTAATLLAQILKEQRHQYHYDAKFYANEVMLRQDQHVGFVNRCSVGLVRFDYCVAQSGRVGGDWDEDHENERLPVFQVERRVGNRKVVSIRPSGSAVVYID